MTKTIALSNSSIFSIAFSETRFSHLNAFKNLPSCPINLVFRNGIAITAGIFTHKQAPSTESSTQTLVSKRKKNLIGPSTKQMGQSEMSNTSIYKKNYVGVVSEAEKEVITPIFSGYDWA